MYYTNIYNIFIIYNICTLQTIYVQYDIYVLNTHVKH